MSANSNGEPSAKSQTFDPKFTDFVRRIMTVPHSEIKAKLDAENAAKRTSKPSSRVPAADASGR